MMLLKWNNKITKRKRRKYNNNNKKKGFYDTPNYDVKSEVLIYLLGTGMKSFEEQKELTKPIIICSMSGS